MARPKLPSPPPQSLKQKRSAVANVFSAALLASCVLLALAGLGTALYFQRPHEAAAPTPAAPAPAVASARPPEPAVGRPVTIELVPSRGAAPAPAPAPPAAPAPLPIAALPDIAPSAPPAAVPSAVAAAPTQPPAPRPQLAALPAPPVVTAPAEPIRPAIAEPPAAKPVPSAPAAEPSPRKTLALARPPAPPGAAAAKEPAMVPIRAGNFMMGSNEDPSEKPMHPVTIRSFAIAKYPVTAGEWRRCVQANACADVAEGGVGGNDEAPISNVSWADAQQYAEWLARETHKRYRLPSEAEWEYAARGGTQTSYWWGNEPVKNMADCKGCSDSYDPHHPTKVGAFKPNPFGLHDMTGTVAEWVADCWHRDYQGAPSDQAVWGGGDCSTHVLRGGSWQNDITYARASSRDNYDTRVRYLTHGFRLALTE